MAVFIKGKLLILAKPKRKRSTHLIAEPYTGSGKFRKANFMYHLGLSHSAVHARMKHFHRHPMPPPEGFDPWAWWNPQDAWEYIRLHG